MKWRKIRKSILVAAIITLIILGVILGCYFVRLLKTNDVKSAGSVTQTTADKELYAFLLSLDKTMGEVLEIDLSNYRKIDTLDGFTTSEYDDLRLLDIKMQIPSEYGDSILSIYLNNDNTKGVAPKQGIAPTKEFNGVYNMYLFERDLDKDSKFAWKITENKSVEGEFKAINETVREHFMNNRTAENKSQ
ncbi:MAG: hypothetical protein EOM30_02630 [Clostridia bacterium]|nr:hypothetical protein [Clostridia bacterium]NLS86035.1 hypothetical protein [Oscillospiraceae bacterium]